MNKRVLPFVFLLILAILVFGLKYWKGEREDVPVKNEKGTSAKNRDRGFDRTLSYLEYTKHALCRMDCRRISKADVEDIMKTGKINYAKTDLNDRPCPTYAVQGTTNDGQNLRVIFAQCNTKTKVVTCYDLDKDFECYCPGDEKKKKN